MSSMTDKERAAFARQGGLAGSRARWEAYYEAHPEKLQAKLAREAKKGKVKRGRPPKKQPGRA
jgi:hypothetical protein